MLRFAKLMALTGLLVAPFFSSAADKLFLENAELKCVADGVEIATEGPNHSEGLRPSEKYIALLGFAAQRNYKGVGNSGAGRELYLERVIQMLQANGFCMANKLDGGGVPTSQLGYGDVVRDKSNKAAPYLMYAVAGLRSREQKDGNTKSALDTKQMKEVVKYFGFQDESHIQNIFKHDGWSSLEPDQRQRLFSEHVENTSAVDPENQNSLRGMYASNEYGEGLKNCFSQMKLMQNSNTIFNLKNTKNGRRPDSRKFCETVAKECKLESTTFCSVSTPTFTKTNDAPKPTGAGSNRGSRSIFDGVKGRQ
jgi:hypothetical protein